MPRNAYNPDVFNATCRSRAVLDRIADKWTALIVCALEDGTRRYSELLRQVAGVSEKMLSQTLRSLERDGIVERKAYPVVPPRVEYSLTPLGRTLADLMASICEWSETHWAQIDAARARYRSRKAS